MSAPKARPDQSLLWELGSRIRARRTALGLSREKLSERAGKHYNQVGKLERGESDSGIRMIVRIAEALDVDPGELVRGLRTANGAREPGNRTG